MYATWLSSSSIRCKTPAATSEFSSGQLKVSVTIGYGDIAIASGLNYQYTTDAIVNEIVQTVYDEDVEKNTLFSVSNRDGIEQR